MGFEDFTLKQIPSHSSKTLTQHLIVENSLELNAVKLKYNHMDYGEEYWEDVGKALIGAIGEKELKKYEKLIKPVEFSLKLEP